MNRILSLSAVLILATLLPAAQAAPTDIATLPFVNASGAGNVRPNLMLLYDNSGSMASTFTPDYVDDSTTCRARATMAAATPRSCTIGHAPFNSADFNKQYYDPAVRYLPPIDKTGASYAPLTDWTAVPTDGFNVNTTNLRGTEETTTNLLTRYPDKKWCAANSTSNCRVNDSGYTYPNGTYYNPVDIYANGPYYYSIKVAEYCTDKGLTNCQVTAPGAAAPAGYPVPAKVRWCNGRALTSCRGKYGDGYIYPRFSDPNISASLFVRTDIVPSDNSYPKAEGRTDCAGATCTYNEEMTNFANWYAYYKTRNQMMKTTVGQAFGPIGDTYNVGIVSLSAAASQGGMTTPKQFAGEHRGLWYKTLYEMDGNGSTPLRPALNSVGKMYANQSPYQKSGDDRVIRYPCQQNFTFMTTDGYWNGPAATGVASNDNAESATRFCTRAAGCVDTRQQDVASLADVALYWYNGGSATASISLRPDLEGAEGIVPGLPGENKRLHMKTYTLGLGVDGLMAYDKNYQNPEPGTDFHKLINGVTSGCPWNNNGAYVWPDPKTDDATTQSYQSRVDDLWHAAVNGHGKYFSASAPLEVVGGLRDALSLIEKQRGTAAAVATSTPQITAQDNALFSTSFKSVDWFGMVHAKQIDPATGALLPGAVWSSNATVGSRVGPSSDTRTIYQLDVTTTPRTLKPFVFGGMTTAEKAWFSGKCSQLAQCLTMTAAQRAVVDNGANLVNWLRGQQQHADNVLYRAYTMTDGTEPGDPSTPLPLVLGDVASSRPAYLREPRKGYPEEDYQTFKTTHANRTPTVFVGANDGMLHAFDAANGTERWAYAPRITMKKLVRQASVTYKTNHQYTVDGSPELADVKINGAWRTILVGGLNAGGRGYYALDVTNPAAPAALWELCADPDVCTGDNFDADIGLTFGNPQFGTWKNAAGAEQWVVFLTSGYNNVPGIDGVNGGSGEGFLYVVDVATGRKLAKIGTGAYTGMAETPAGLARITAITPSPNAIPLVSHVYGGDNLGRMWRFAFGASGSAQVLMLGNAGATQPITSRPDVTMCRANPGSSELVRVVAFGTGRLLDETDIANTSVQSTYVLKDKDVSLGSIPSASLVQRTLSPVAGDPTRFTVNGVAVDLSTKDGWYVRYNQHPGERVNLDAAIVRGTLAVFTNTPSASAECKVGGSSNVYHFDVCNGEGTGADLSDSIVVGGPPVKLPPPPPPNDDPDGDGGPGDTCTGPNCVPCTGPNCPPPPSAPCEVGNMSTLVDGTQKFIRHPSCPTSGAERAGWRRVRE